jgi:hypothetical protein
LRTGNACWSDLPDMSERARERSVRGGGFEPRRFGDAGNAGCPASWSKRGGGAWFSGLAVVKAVHWACSWRHRRNTPVPQRLREPYYESLKRLPGLVSGASERAWDVTLCQSILAAAAVGKSQHAIAELLLEIDHTDIPETLRWYFSR